jgi:hypothetical protein
VFPFSFVQVRLQELGVRFQCLSNARDFDHPGEKAVARLGVREGVLSVLELPDGTSGRASELLLRSRHP